MLDLQARAADLEMRLRRQADEIARLQALWDVASRWVAEAIGKAPDDRVLLDLQRLCEEARKGA